MSRSVVARVICVGRAGTSISLRAAVMLALLLALLVVAEPARSASTTFTVNSVDDDVDADIGDGECETATANECTLRAAIQEANSTADADTITFDIGGAAVVKTIDVGSSDTASGQSLPEIIQPVTIDGYTQGDGTPGDSSDDATENTIPVARDGTNATLRIELNGTSAEDNGIAINTSNVEVRGLVINRFSTGIFIFLDGSGAAIEGNFIGTDPTGTQARANSSAGVSVFGGGANTIGGREAAAHNLISGNFRGISIASNTGNTIQGNLIGTNKDGTDTPNSLGNTLAGLSISSSNNIVGSAAGDNDLDSNLIAFNGDEGVFIFSGTGNRILNNRIHSNGKLGINLEGGTEDSNGVTKNDGRARDRDTGANNLQNFPVLTSATTAGGTTTIKGKLRSTPRVTFIIQFFSSLQKDPSGFGEGMEFMGERRVTTDREGRGSFTFKTGAITGAFVTTTATRFDPTILLPTDTSEFSAAKRVTLAR